MRAILSDISVSVWNKVITCDRSPILDNRIETVSYVFAEPIEKNFVSNTIPESKAFEVFIDGVTSD